MPNTQMEIILSDLDSFLRPRWESGRGIRADAFTAELYDILKKRGVTTSHPAMVSLHRYSEALHRSFEV